MTEHLVLILTILRLTIVALGGAFLFFTGRSYLRHRQRNILVLFFAVATITAGAVVEGAMRQFLGTSADAAHITESVFLLLGFAILLGSVLLPVRERAE